MHFTLAKCKLACLGTDYEKSKGAIESLEKAKQGFKRLQMLHKIVEICFMEAKLYNVLKDLKKRDEISKEFRENHQLLEERKNQIGFPANFVIDTNLLQKELQLLIKK